METINHYLRQIITQSPHVSIDTLQSAERREEPRQETVFDAVLKDPLGNSVDSKEAVNIMKDNKKDGSLTKYTTMRSMMANRLKQEDLR